MVLPNLLLILSFTFCIFGAVIGIGFDLIMMLIRENLMMFRVLRKEQFKSSTRPTIITTAVIFLYTIATKKNFCVRNSR